MAQTGYQRSLTVKVVKKTNDVIQSEITYRGMESFTYNEVDYPAIIAPEMASMPEVKFHQRVAAFKKYVESKEGGLHFDTDLQEGFEAYRFNDGVCPIDYPNYE